MQVWYLHAHKAINHFISKPEVIAKHLCTVAPNGLRKNPSLSRLQLTWGLTQAQPHSPDLLGISLNFCFAPSVMNTAGSQGLHVLSWQGKRFGRQLRTLLRQVCNSHNSQRQQGQRGPSEQQIELCIFLSPRWW